MNKLTWEFNLKPTPMSRQYLLFLEYSINKSPKVFVKFPDLSALANGNKIPHMYDQKKGLLCLYLPMSGEWSRNALLSDTVVPWASVWLYFFEVWLFTGQWEGGGKHPDINDNKISYNKKLPKRFTRK